VIVQMLVALIDLDDVRICALEIRRLRTEKKS
jgi:hypothetical protein